MGVFISFEGPEGSGKSSVIQAVSNLLKEQGYDVLITREPGGIAISEKIRDLILDPNHPEMDAKTEALLYAASRRQHLVEKIIPALEQGKLVISDRFIDSSLAYQGHARGLGIEEVMGINQFAIENHMPQLTLFFDVPIIIGQKRIEKRNYKDRLEQESLNFHNQVLAAYQKLHQDNPKRIKRIDASQPLDRVVEQTFKVIKDFLDAQ